MSSHRPLLGLILAGLCVAATPALAQGAQRIRGTVESISGDQLVVKSTSGAETTLTLAPNWAVTAVVPSSLSEIKPGTFIGTAATGPDDKLVAREVLVFPPALKGSGEGHYAWDLGPKSTMTNATVDGDVTRADGQELTLSYKGGQSKVMVPPGIPVVTFGPGDRSMVTPGAKVFIPAKGENGALTASRVLVGKDGLTPPM
ncbi:MAG TPA: hypothetical protein VIJ55_05230 [Acetobacteraceae bacterium]